MYNHANYRRSTILNLILRAGQEDVYQMHSLCNIVYILFLPMLFHAKEPKQSNICVYE